MLMLPQVGFLGAFGAGGGALTLTEVGTATSVAGTTTIALVTGVTIPAGSVIVVSVGIGSGTGTLSSISDGTNTYGVDVTTISGGVGAGIGSAANAGLASGGTITATLTATSNDKQIWVGYISNAATVTPLDKTANAIGTSTAPSASTAATTVANEVVLACVECQNSATVTEAGGYTGVTEVNGTNVRLHTAYKIVSVTGVQTYAPTLSGNVKWTDLVATYHQ